MRHLIETNKLTIWLSRTLTVLAAGVLSFSMLVGVTGCETTEGVGRDIEAAGEGIQEGADRADPGPPDQW
ncbi:entericidin A/B family lipoprotein [Phycisphaerales bacterium AB-hyl4]|uniref:Entericidin A/B family lipoprotein n=1 Tax=Natronomicrosphaera hydrolytica TaxID=3242702 RepID=A0ABV4U0V2_9BACT